jgi:hypothetical protein
MKYTLRGWLVKNHLITGKPDEKFLKLYSKGTLTLDNVINLMEKENTGLRRETIEHVVKLFNRVVAGQIMEGYAVNTDLFHAAPQAQGVIENGLWNPEKNAIRVSFTEDKDMREAIARTAVHIVGENRPMMYVVGVEDVATGATDGTATAGGNYILYGRMLKVAGDHESVGVTLTDTAGQTTKLDHDMIAVNHPKKLILLLPATLPKGEYALTITTQFSNRSSLLRTPRTLTKEIIIR